MAEAEPTAGSGMIDVPKLDVLHVNGNSGSHFRILHTGTNQDRLVLLQVTR